MSSIAYFLKESLTGFSRNISTALGSIVTIFLSLMIIGIFFVGGIVVENIASSLENKVSIAAFVADDASQSDIDALSRDIESLEGVASVSFTTKEQALENFRSSNTTDIIDSLDGQNPLPASVDVELSDPQKVEDVASAIRENTVFQQIHGYGSAAESLKYGEQSVDRLFSLTNSVRYIGMALIALLIFIAMVFINNTIRLAILARRKEIAIMRLVGASNGFIRGPFLMEGALHAIIGSLLAVGSLELLRNFALPQVQENLKFLPIDLSFTTFVSIYAALIVAGLFIGLVGSALAMRRYLKV